jgi:hypothetical protein
LAALLLLDLAACTLDSSGLSGSSASGRAGTGGIAATSGSTGGATGGSLQSGTGGGTGGLVAGLGGSFATGGSGVAGAPGTGGNVASQTGGVAGGAAGASGGVSGSGGQPGPDARDAGNTDGAGTTVGAGGAGAAGGAGGHAGQWGWNSGGTWGGTGGWWGGGTGGTTQLPMCDSSLRDKTACTPGAATCQKSCGVDDLATKPCSCVNGSWSCGTCTYPPGDYSCYQLPTFGGVPSCSPGTTNGVTACFGMCSLCADYLDSTGTPKTGYCACLNDGPAQSSVYRCASTSEWPPQQ